MSTPSFDPYTFEFDNPANYSSIHVEVQSVKVYIVKLGWAIEYLTHVKKRVNFPRRVLCEVNNLAEAKHIATVLRTRLNVARKLLGLKVRGR